MAGATRSYHTCAQQAGVDARIPRQERSVQDDESNKVPTTPTSFVDDVEAAAISDDDDLDG
eukprot:9486876-Pyramimonas_sp.AAC.1